MKSDRQVKIVTRKKGEENAVVLVDYLARKCCPLWRRVLGVFDPNIAMRWEMAWKVKNSRTINVALERTGRKIVAAGVDVQKDGIAVHVEEHASEKKPEQVESEEGK